MRLSIVLVVLVVLGSFGASACASRVGSDTESAPVGATSSAVIKGTASPASQDSVVMIQMGSNGFCSGTLVAPNLVLTARHCVSNLQEDDCATLKGDMTPSTLGVAVGGSANDRSTAVAHAKKFFYSPGKDLCASGDFAMILLDTSITSIPTSKVRAAPVTKAETFTAVGYGEDENKQVNVRRQRTGVQILAIGPAKETFTPTNAAAFTYEIPAGEIATSEAVCHGDSGGPLFDAQGRVVGMTSRGADPNDICVARPDIFAAVNHHLDIVDQAFKEAGFPRDTSDDPKAEPGPKGNPEDDGPAAENAAEEEEEDTPVTKKSTTKKAAQPVTPAGCAVTRVSDGYGNGRFAALLLGLVAVAMIRARRA